MADIYVRPYGDRRGNPLRTGLFIAAALVLIAGVWIWLANRPAGAEQVDKAAPPAAAAVTKTVTAAAAPASPDAGLKARRLFERAQTLAGSGQLGPAQEMLTEAAGTTTDESLKNNALRMLGRINVELFLSDAPSPEKKSYVIQPGDSLDRIARQNKTTVALLQKMNRIEGSLIYPGARIWVPAAPFVIKVDKSDRTLDLTVNGRFFKRYAVGLGRYGKTPLGTFLTVVHQTNPDWSPPNGGIIPFGDPRNVLGTRWISIQDKTRPDIKGFGIHGTAERDSIGGETSNGCIRMLNEDVEEVFMLIPRGTEVIISE
jgi:lipoprotein-anchoring transpeptidase ErfK/SrfK